MIERCFKKYGLTLTALIAILILPQVCPAQDAFSKWVSALRAEALAKGISAKTLDAALSGLQPVQKIIELDQNQPEFKKDYQGYMNMTVTDKRIKKGRQLLINHGELLENIEASYGIQPHFLVAIWGLETNFGAYIGKFPVIASVATLAYEARRSKFFRAELLHALKILDEGHIDISDMQGSWAGAMGQIQFMPSTFVSFAVDQDKDGRKDIWHSLPDAFASAANFLSRYGWRPDHTWGMEVQLPQKFNSNLAGMGTEKSLAAWQKTGIRLLNGQALPDVDMKASLIQPAGSDGPAFLVYQNYRALMRWNRSHLYALAVCHLADQLAITDKY